jgi:two-component system sensor histidine kinase ChvG
MIYNKKTDEIDGGEKEIAPRPLSRLTYKIMGINAITLVILAMSFLYISQTRENLIQNEIDNFETESRMYSIVLNKSLGNSQSNMNQISQILVDLEVRSDQQASLYSDNSTKIFSTGHIPERKAFVDIRDKNLNMLPRIFAAIEDFISVDFKLPYFPGAEKALNEDVPKFQQTIKGLNISAWSAEDGGLILGSHINLIDNKLGIKTLQLVRRDLKIEESFADTRLAIFRFALISFTMTVAFSLYLAGLIGHPLRNLAMAAETFRFNRGRNVEIPDLSYRNDEIGELSHVMREMTKALNLRLTAIEQFAADVAHELKNPISSMKSALETIPKVKKDSDKQQLMAVLHHDLERMDRLISDISQASRLDTELSRDVLVPVDVCHILNLLIDAKSDPSFRREGERNGNIIKIGFDLPAYAMGQSGRLAQVFDNLISNALSFSKDKSAVRVLVEANENRVKVIIEDEGPGIPESRLDKIFDRFYSERPVTEGFGMHSGLGLSIAKQIIESHGGSIHAENRKDDAGQIVGARFIVRLGVA